MIVSKAFHPPLSRLIDWRAAARGSGFPVLFAHPRWLPRLAVILKAVPDKLWRAMQRSTMGLAALLDIRSLINSGALLAELVLARDATEAS